MVGFNAEYGQADSSSSMNQDVFGPEQFNTFYSNMNDMWSKMQPFAMGGMNYVPGMDETMREAVGRGGEGSEYMLGGGSFGDTTDVRNKLMGMMGGRSNMGSMYESIVGGPGNTYIDPMVKAMRTSGNEALDTRLGQEGLGAASMGQTGGSRHAMQNAMLERKGLQDMNLLEQNMRAGAYDKDLEMKMGIAEMADQNRQLEQDRLMGMMTGADQNVGGGMDYQKTMQDLGMGEMAPYMQAMMMPFMMMQMYSQSMGDPTVLTEAESESSSKSGGGGFGF